MVQPRPLRTPIRYALHAATVGRLLGLRRLLREEGRRAGDSGRGGYATPKKRAGPRDLGTNSVRSPFDHSLQPIRREAAMTSSEALKLFESAAAALRTAEEARAQLADLNARIGKADAEARAAEADASGRINTTSLRLTELRAQASEVEAELRGLEQRRAEVQKALAEEETKLRAAQVHVERLRKTVAA
jgi:hypothetical protein